MNNFGMKRQKNISKLAVIIALALFASIVCVLIYYAYQWKSDRKAQNFTDARTFFGIKREIGEPFGIAEKDGEIFVSDGENGRILRISDIETFAVVTDKLNTPSAIAFDQNGDLIVADSGSHTIKKINLKTGAVELIAGIENEKGFADGKADASKFNAPVGIAVGESGKIFVADTYNDRIRVIESGQVSTLSGSVEGFSDGIGASAKFDTPCGIALSNDGKLLVADAGNSRIRVIEQNGKTWTLAGSDRQESTDGLLDEAGFLRPTAITIDKVGTIFVADGDAIRAIGRRAIPFVETISAKKTGFTDGNLNLAKFNRPSGLAIGKNGELFVADSENQVVRVLTSSDLGNNITKEEVSALRYSPEEFRGLGNARWTYDPPENPREIAGTLGEIRGEIKDEESEAWFHNGLDIVGGYGERARFIRSEKVLNPIAVQNFATLREMIRMPTLGYIHIRLGRNVNSAAFTDARFQFSVDEKNELVSLRVPRGAKFEAGEAIGTLNAMNHVHLVAGRRGNEMNALDALTLPGISDSRAPTIEKITLFDENWQELLSGDVSTKLSGKTRIVAKAYDQMDGNTDRRRLGVFRLGYQVLKQDKSPLADIKWTIDFDRLPFDEALYFVYAKGSKSGATGETVFNYIVSNTVNGDDSREDYLDISNFENGEYVLRIFAADFFGNQAYEDLKFEISK
jgi:DNA-binding beta-propeller fold protein YncE